MLYTPVASSATGINSNVEGENVRRILQYQGGAPDRLMNALKVELDMSDQLPVLSELAEGVLLLTLNRPDRLNAFNEDMHLALRTGFERARDEANIRAVLLTGAGRGFCAGQDLSDLNTGTGPIAPGGTLVRFYNPLVCLMRSLEKPIVCAVNGVAAGAGANIALACDIVLAAKSARFIQAFARIGLVPDCGGTWTLTAILGEARAKALALTAEPLDAETAERWGLIWKAVADEALMSEAQSLAARLATGPTISLGLTKRAIQAATTQSLAAQLKLEAELQRQAGATADYAEGVAAFLAKRSPTFQGK